MLHWEQLLGVQVKKKIAQEVKTRTVKSGNKLEKVHSYRRGGYLDIGHRYVGPNAWRVVKRGNVVKQ